MSVDPDKLYDELAALLGEEEMSQPLQPVCKTVDVARRVEHLGILARKVVNVPGLPDDAEIRFREIRLKKGNRIHSLLVDVLMNKRRYTAALRKRLSLGIRDPQKWIEDLNEAVRIAIESKPVAWNSVENYLHDRKKRKFTFGIGEDGQPDEWGERYPGCYVTLWGDRVVDAKGPVELLDEMVQEILKEGD